MPDWIAIAISALALLLSSATAWLTLFRRGDLQMTQPTQFFLGPDGGRHDRKPRLKVYLRTLLYSTSRRGQTVESMHVGLERGESKQNFSIWVYGERDRLARGSGIYVGQEGVVCNHHFLLPEDGADFKLLAGRYTVRVYAKRVSDRQPRQLALVTLNISESHARELQNEHAGIYFDWGPDQQAYHPFVEIRPPAPLPPWLLEAAGAVPELKD